MLFSVEQRKADSLIIENVSHPQSTQKHRERAQLYKHSPDTITLKHIRPKINLISATISNTANPNQFC